ncbi:hypothetical protein V3C99_011171 [Haemonchus contortus]
MLDFNVFSSEAFDIIQDTAYYNAIYEDIGVQLDAQLFAINGPFMLDSQFDASKRPDRRVRKRKHKSWRNAKNVGEINRIEKLSKDIRTEGLRIAFFSAQSIKDNNHKARERAREVCDRSIKMYRPAPIASNEIITLSDNSPFILEEEFCMLNSWYKNDSDHCIHLHVSERRSDTTTTHYVPPGATFHIGSVSDVRNFAAINGLLFDLVVIDPPWNNLCVKRQQSYVTCESPLDSVDLNCLAPTGLVAIWITNKKGIEGELDAFFRQWKLTRLATFIWLKVTLEGDPVCSFNGGHKLPYERLVFASHAESSSLYSDISSSDGKVFASVPMAVPSRKPPVVPIVKQYGIVPKQPLELFARSLLPYTVSVGYEALLLQSSLCLISLNKDNEG